MTDPTAPPTPESAGVLFGERITLAERYAALLAGPGIIRGLIGPREIPRLWERHILNCAVVAPRVPSGVTVADVGSGAGLPGIVWAIARPDLDVVLIEPLLRRTRFLDEAVAELGLVNVQVIRSRAENLAKDVTVDVATARAVAPIATLAGWTLPLLRPHGILLAFKGQSVADELASAANDLVELGASKWRVEEFGHGTVDPVSRVAIVERGG